MTRNVLYVLLRGMAAGILIFLAASCGEPAENGSFVKQSGRDTYGRYMFSIDLSDSLRKHTILIYTMIDAGRKDFGRMPELLPFSILAVSPSGREYAENAGLPKDSYSREEPFSRQYEAVYREGFEPSEYGIWKIYITVPGENRFPGLRGIGLKHIAE